MNHVLRLHIVGGVMLAVVLVACESPENDAEPALPAKSEGTAGKEPERSANKNAIPFDVADLDLLLLNQHAGAKTTYGAQRTEENRTTGVVTLTGNAWIRMGDVIFDGRDDPNSMIRLDQTTGRVISKEGEVEFVTLLKFSNNGAQPVGEDKREYRRPCSRGVSGLRWLEVRCLRYDSLG